MTPSGTVTQLTSGPDFNPTWSPDGTEFAFVRDPFDAPSWIMAINVEDGSLRTIAPAGDGNTIAWSPDGDRIAYTVNDPFPSQGRQIWTFKADGSGDAEQITSSPTHKGISDWEPLPLPIDSLEITQAIQELQTPSELEADLKADGNPPVPIVAGKPAVLRIYAAEVDEPTTLSFEVSGEVEGTEILIIDTECTPEQRRRQEDGCHSAEFYFTPPSGAWSINLKVKNVGGELLEEHDFDLVSVEPDGIVLKAVSVCDARGAGLISAWQCEDATKLGALALLLRQVAPTDDVRVQHSGEFVRRLSSDFADPVDWWFQVGRDTSALYGSSDTRSGQLFGEEIYYFGLTRPSAPGVIDGGSTQSIRGAVSRSVMTAGTNNYTPGAVAHLVATMMGLSKTGVAPEPGCWQSIDSSLTWPYGDNQLHSGDGTDDVEVGFDVVAHQALPGDQFFDLMGNCALRWVSPFTTLQMPSPTGPLRFGASSPNPVEGDFWSVSGTTESDAVTFDPLFVLETEESATAGAGSFRIEIQAGGGESLFTRFFTPAQAVPSLPPGVEFEDRPPSFGELIPVQQGAARIVVIDGSDQEIGAIDLGGEAPVVSISPIGGVSGVAGAESALEVNWSVEDADSDEHTYRVDYSPDGGETWQSQGMGLTESGLGMDPGMLAGSDDALIRVLASDGVNTGMVVSESFGVAKKLPTAEITALESNTSHRVHELVWLQGFAFDYDDGFLEDGAVMWSSSRDGALGTGTSLPVYDLSEGTHTITMTAEDSDGNQVSDSINVTVFDAPLVDGETTPIGFEAIWADNNCSGSADPIDSLLTLRFDAGLQHGRMP